MWAPFVRQCIEMVRDHEHNFVRGPGFQRDHDGTVTEKCALAPLPLHCPIFIARKTILM